MYLGYSTNATTTATAWYDWNAIYSSGTTAATIWRVETQAQRAAREQEYREQLQRELKENEDADARAERLLLENLNKEQHAEYVKGKTFTVIGKTGERRYRIHKGWSHNIERIDAAGKRLGSLCAHPSARVPEYDNMLAQKLALELDEDEFLKIANAR